ncbi:gliding motility-associated C-terminal domain-containing protein [Winogradskyella alexanderae]|uniref:Gliding motility-associated C-terminal domain-containing protein n=1 Tax=Winogradskyella alexanderae TaxID=2877123 RepID=A0ABS7XSF0_9FLAO|nr:gliding motility-associated C-terminal domain-containing protein [Winogradskyella alexanderae]MCA0132389.1 gliding motility-associated C-terminal domain-containing protein [Winogradskyella alexanderae]
MKRIFSILIIMSVGHSWSQSEFHNFGNLQIHDEGQIGFHVNLQNDGAFNQNLGLAGFYNSTESLFIYGTEIPKFFDMEVEVPNHLNLLINTEVENSLSYISGDIVTPRLSPSISLDFLGDSFYVLESDFQNTDGYASYDGSNEFSFPIGADNKLRPLITPVRTSNLKFSAAYFNEDPNFPSTFTEGFNTNNFEGILNVISDFEFWDFDGSNETIVTLTWEQSSGIDDLVSNLDELRVVGWHIADQEWKDLGNSSVSGSFLSGQISSFIFNPNEYEVITFGSLKTSDELEVYNLISPNGDGLNDVFVIDGITLFDNEVKIFNRWGNKVFETRNYQNDWNGFANTGRIFGKGEALPVGTYFYTVELKDENLNFAGWLYINY